MNKRKISLNNLLTPKSRLNQTGRRSKYLPWLTFTFLFFITSHLFAQNVTVSANFNSLTGDKVNHRVFGLNAFKGFDPVITANSSYKANMAAMSPGHIRYHSWEMIATSGNTSNSWVNSNGDWDAARINTCLNNNPYPGAEILINIPWPPSVKGWLVGGRSSKLKSQNIDDFADWCAELVQIVNVQQGRNVKYWEFTNERDGVYEGDEETLAQIFAECVQAAKAVDNSIKVGGPAFERPDISSRVVSFLQAAKDDLDFVSMHGYPYADPPSDRQVIFDRADNFSQDLVNMQDDWDNISNRDIEFHFNEYNMSYNPPSCQNPGPCEMDTEVGMIFDALVMRSMLNAGADVAAAWNESDGWFGKTDGSHNREPSSWVFELFNKDLIDGANIVSSSSSAEKKIAQLVSRSGNTVQVLLINRSLATQKVYLDLNNVNVSGSTSVSIDEAIASGGKVSGSTSISNLTSGNGYTSDPYAVTVLTFEVSGGGGSGNTQSPFNGVADIPGVIQAEDYDNGGQNVAYNDSDTGNNGGQYRNGNVDIQSTSDAGGGFNVGWTSAGEWLEYTVDVASSGTYDLDIRHAGRNNGNIEVVFSGGGSSGDVSIPATGSSGAAWQTWATKTVSGINLSAGEQVMRVNVNSGGFNFNYVELKSIGGGGGGGGNNNGTPEIESFSAAQSSNPASNILDGDPSDNSRWAAQSFPQSVVIDYGEVKSIIGTRVHTYLDRAYQYKVEMSTDLNFNEPIVVNRLNNTSSSQPISDDFAAVSARYVKLTVEGASGYSGNWVSITEFEIVEGSGGGGGGSTNTVSLSPIHDAHLKGSTRVDNASIRVEQGSRVAYLMFDLSSINGTITEASLDMVVARDDGNGNMNVIKGQSNNWTEDNLSNSNKPSEGAILASRNRTWNIGDPVSIDLNASGLTAGTNNSLILKQTSGNDFGFSSKEGNDAPQLVITYTTTSAMPNNTSALKVSEAKSTTEKFKLFPNPSEEFVMLQFAEAVKTVRILDVSGKIVKELIAPDNYLTVSLQDMSGGIYFCNVLYENGTVEVQKFVKQ